MYRGYEYCVPCWFRMETAIGLCELTIKAQTVALNAPSTGFAVSMVVTLLDEVVEAADVVDVAIDCAAAETANTAGMMVYNRIVVQQIQLH